MSHFPAGQVYSSVPAFPGTKQTQELAMATGDVGFAVYTATLDFGSTGTDPYLLFTTDANRGRFFPIGINIIACHDSRNGATISNPACYIGWQNPGKSNAYDNWVSQESVQSITDNVFGPGMYDNMTMKGPVWNAFLSAPPSTGIYLNIAPNSTVTKDVRTVVIFGIYTG